MKNKLPSYIKSRLLAVTERGFEAYVVGGAVRDLLLDIEPGDFDVTTSAHPEDVLTICHAQNWRTVDNLGNNFGCVIAIVEDVPVEITTFRGESYGADAHKPEQVWYCDSLREDLSRRDFTVNAMALDIDGKLYDYFDGQKDLQNKESSEGAVHAPSLFCHVISIRMSPVLVRISHMPPVMVFGTVTRPVSVTAINTFSLRRLPVTSPVSVKIVISDASLSFSHTSPVPLCTDSF